MRVRANEGRGYRHRVWLGGEEVSSRCIEADDYEGYVLLFVQKDGKTQKTEDGRGLLLELRRGEVRIECKENPCCHCGHAPVNVNVIIKPDAQGRVRSRSQIEVDALRR